MTRNDRSGSAIRRHILKFILGIWMLALVVTIPPWFGWSHYELEEATLTCTLHWKDLDGNHLSYPIFFMLAGIVAPLTTKAVCYYNLYNKVYTVARKVRYSRMSVVQLALRVSTASTASNMSAMSAASTASKLNGSLNRFTRRLSTMHQFSDVRKERKLAKTMAFLVFISLVSWCPYCTTLLCMFFLQSMPPELIMILSILAKICVVYNPLIYVALNKKFRHSFLKTLTCGHYTRGYTNQVIPANRRGEGEEPGQGTSYTSRRSSSIRMNSVSAKAICQYRFSQPALATINEQGSQTGLAGSRYGLGSPPLEDYRPGSKMSLPETDLRVAHRMRKTTDETVEFIHDNRLFNNPKVRRKHATLQRVNTAQRDDLIKKTNGMPKVDQ